jgi:hypothetical protein
MNVGDLIHIENYQLPSEVKNKYFIVLYRNNEESIVVAMTTSKVYIREEFKIPGIIKTDSQHLYFIPKNKIIGRNGFYFKKDTFILTFNNAFNTDIELLKSTYSEIEIKCKLLDSEFLEIIYCFYKSPYVSKRHKRMLEPIIEDLSNRI